MAPLIGADVSDGEAGQRQRFAGGLRGRQSGGAIAVVFHDDGQVVQARQARVGQDRPLAAFDVDLGEVGPPQMLEDVDGRDVDAVLALAGRVGSAAPAGREAQGPW